jgi:hypothetical protein
VFVRACMCVLRVQLLKDQAKLYIFISTDSVYDVTDKQHDNPSMESDDVRPASLEEQEVSTLPCVCVYVCVYVCMCVCVCARACTRACV